MARTRLLALYLLLVPLRVDAQGNTAADREALLAAVAEHAVSTITSERQAEIALEEVVFWTDDPALDEAAARSGLRIGTREDAIECAMPGRDCVSLDGTEGAVRVMDVVIDGRTATVLVDVLFLMRLEDQQVLTGRADRLHLALGDDGWRVDHVDPVAQR